MRAIRVNEPGGPEQLHLGEAPDPAPAAGEVVVAVAAAGVNRADLLQRQGAYAPPPGASDILGLEVSGTVAELGAEVRGWERGEAVCALLTGGGYAERVAVPAAQLLRIPPGMALVEAAAIPEVFITAHDALVTRGRLARGETVLIHGGGGGVGTAAIQLAHRLGARVLVTAGSPAKLERCAERGAEAGSNHREEDCVARAREWRGGDGVDRVLDLIGAADRERNLQALASDGRLVMIGLQGGTRAELDLGLALRRRLSLVATTLRARPVAEKAVIIERMRTDVMPGFADGALRTVIDRVLPLAGAAEAHRLLASGALTGKVLLAV
ncbi:MAG: NAD(P)H-quinone oxidoreductase [Candidatus Dormibacteria bacterium]